MKLFAGLCLFAAIFCMAVPANSQSKTKKSNPPAEAPKEEVVPPVQEPGDLGIDTSAVILPPQQIPPVVSFDTTAVPEDAFTKMIRDFLKLTKAREMEISVMEKTLKRSLENAMKDENSRPLMEKFYTRFVEEVKTGKGAQWLENLYIRAYRKAFTPEDLKLLTEFYQTPSGKRILAGSITITNQVMAEAPEIGKYLAEIIFQQILSEQ